MSDSLKRRLTERLSPRSKLLARRLFVGSIGACVRLAAWAYRLGERAIELAVTHGLDLGRAWDVRPTLRPPRPHPFGVRDFLMLTEAAAAHASTPSPPASADGATTIKTSVIIPVFNQVEFTFQCLRSLLRELDFSETEVIVVDDGSADETLRVLSHFEGFVRVVVNEKNLGFVGACNRGAEAARGRYLVFLNNDTVVLPGWLSHLVETAEADVRVGAVGSLFLYPDGRIQEAGAIVWRDGTLYHYGWGRSPDEKKYIFAREVDYCSGASLLVRRDLFERLGGFDDRYSPAYFEDADLCFGVRSLGFKVVYQPASRLVHYEGATAGTDSGSGVKQYQIVNRWKFYEKWRDLLERDHVPHDLARRDEAADRRRGPYIFVFDDRLPTPDRDAGSGRMLHILRALARWSRPVFVYASKQVPNSYEAPLWAAGVETATLVEYPRLLRERRPRAAVISRPYIADLLLDTLRRQAPGMKLLFDMVDVHFVRFEREAAVTGDARAAREAEVHREVETRIARSSDLIWCASSEDARVMERAAPRVPIHVIPTVHSPRGQCASFEARRGLLFVGNYSHHPNEDAIHYLVREILPLVRELIPDVTAFLVGDNATDEIRAYESEDVRVLGYVRDVEPLFGGCRVFVAPLRFGAGIKGKIGEAFAHGLPVVTTGIGAESMGITDGVQALIRDDPREFAEATARAYLDRELWEKLSREGLEHAARHFSPQVVGAIINDSLRGIIEPAATERAAGTGDALPPASEGT
jgi:GT2 family glycosyltransferase